MQFKAFQQDYYLPVMIWLISLTIMVFLIIIIGGLTRLTDSGLSMVDWRPILGTIPPLNDNQWIEIFEQNLNHLGLLKDFQLYLFDF